MLDGLRDPVIVKALGRVGALFLAFAAFAFFLVVVKRARWEEVRSILKNYLAWLFILPVLFIPLLAGGRIWIGAVAVLSLVAFREFACATGLWRDRLVMWVATACIAGVFYPVAARWYVLFLVMPIFATLVLLTVPLGRDRFDGMIQRTCLALLGVIYFGWCLSHLGYLIHLKHGMRHDLFVVLLTELNDIAAYHIGKAIGVHPLSPRVSPHKTVEGTLGGLAAVGGLAFFFRGLVPEFSTAHLLLVAILIAIAGTLGDLAISFIKRDLGLKNLGKLIPGQGGVLDRFDSLIFVAPVFFHFTVYFYKDLLPLTWGGPSW